MGDPIGMSAADSRPFKPLVYGCAGIALTEDERRFFAEQRPVGLILFRRNCVDPDQVRALSSSFREIVKNENAPVFIDEEGGRVQRMRGGPWWSAPSAGAIGAVAERSQHEAEALALDVGRAIGARLAVAGVNVDFAPCLDVVFPYTHEAIGDRAFHADPTVVAALGAAWAEGLAQNGVQATLKHLPGHGRAKLDSHYDLPVIDASLKQLEIDFAPFALNKGWPWGIVSHLVFTALDPEEPATTSPKIIREIIRDRIGFAGLLASDDISMKALKAPVEVSSARALAAGCDIVVHCNGDMTEMTAIAEAIGPADDALLDRLTAVTAPLQCAVADLGALHASIDARLGRAAA